MTQTTLFPNLRIARDLKITTRKNKILEGDWSFSVFLDGLKLGDVAQFSACLPLDVTIPPGYARKLVDAMRAKGYTNRNEHLVPDVSVEDLAGFMAFDILREEDSLKKMKRAAKTKTIAVLKDAKPGTVTQFKLPFNEDSKAQVIAHYPAGAIAFFINEDIADL